MTGGIRDLKVWQEAVALAADVVRTLRPANRREVKSVVEEAMRSATLIPLLIADGHSRYDAADQQPLYAEARREVARLETHLAVARQADLIAAPAYQQLGVRTQQVNRLLGGFLVYLDRQVAQTGRPLPVLAVSAGTAVTPAVP